VRGISYKIRSVYISPHNSDSLFCTDLFLQKVQEDRVSTYQYYEWGFSDGIYLGFWWIQKRERLVSRYEKWIQHIHHSQYYSCFIPEYGNNLYLHLLRYHLLELSYNGCWRNANIKTAKLSQTLKKQRRT